jgi:hypothetical protein
MPIAELFSGVRAGSIAAFTVTILAAQTAAPPPALGAWGNGWHGGGNRGSTVGWDGGDWHGNAGFGGWHGGWAGWHGGTGGWHFGWRGFGGGWGWRSGYGWRASYGWRGGYGWRAGWAGYAPGWGVAYAPRYNFVANAYAVRPAVLAPAIYVPSFRRGGYFHHAVHHVVSVCR